MATHFFNFFFHCVQFRSTCLPHSNLFPFSVHFKTSTPSSTLSFFLSLCFYVFLSIDLYVLRSVNLSLFEHFVLLIYLSLSTSFHWSICLCVLCYIDLSISLYVLCSIELSTSVYFFPLIFTSFFPIHYVLFLYKCTSVFCPFSLCSYLVSV